MNQLVIQSVDGIRTHAVRSLATVVVIAVATALSITVPGLARSNQAGVAAVFAATTGREVTWRANPDNPLTPSDVDRLAGLAGVRASGASFATTLVAATPWSATDNVGVLAVHGDLASATRMSFTQGGMWSDQAAASHAPVAIVGQSVASELGIAAPGALVLINGLDYLVTGMFIEGVPAGLSDSVLIPWSSATTDFPLAERGLSVAVAASTPENLQQLAEWGALTLSPSDPTMVRADYSTGAQELGQIVGARLELGSYALTVLAALVAAVLTAVFLHAAVRSRRSEIGLRKALGASQAQIMTQFLLEGCLLGLIGAGVGSLVGVVAVHLVALINHWPTVLASRVVELTFVQTLLATQLAALQPAWSAARTDPIEALTSAE